MQTRLKARVVVGTPVLRGGVVSPVSMPHPSWASYGRSVASYYTNIGHFNSFCLVTPYCIVRYMPFRLMDLPRLMDNPILVTVQGDTVHVLHVRHGAQ